MKRPTPPILLSMLCGFALPWLGGCVSATLAPVAVGLGADIAIFHRSLPDTLFSAITGRDCSVVRLDRGESYCRPVDPPVPPTPYCTRSLAGVDCWASPERMPNIPMQVAQGPHQLTPEQDRKRLARWPASIGE